MSLKPGIGATWFHKYWRDIYKTRDGIVAQGGNTTPPPRYYDKLLEKIDIKLRIEKETERIQKQIETQGDNTTERLKVKEQVTLARLRFKQTQSKI